jgi:TPR repeat
MRKLENLGRLSHLFATCVAAALLILPCSAVAAYNICGQLPNAYGPFDYTDADQRANKLPIVEVAHFTDEVEQGIKGNTGTVGGDLDYTLRAFPNHHRALTSVMRIALRDKVVQIPGSKYPVECYFVRAIRFKPNDGAVHAIFGNYLFALGKSDRALEEFKRAVQLDPENPSINYNLGLIYLKAHNYELANTYAKKAYALGFPLPGLKNMLVEAGKWDSSTQDSKQGNEQAAASIDKKTDKKTDDTHDEGQPDNNKKAIQPQ